VRLASICADLGIEIVPPNARQPGPGQTTAKATLQGILTRYGEGHLILLLRTFTETENRTGARIDEFALYAISDIMIAYPQWADSGLRWFDVWDGINLAAIQREAKANRDAVPQRWGIGTLLYRELHAAFAHKPDVAPPKQTARQQREAMAAAKARIVESRVELGLKLAALRDTTPSNKRFGGLVRERFGLDDSLHVAEMMRVARRYGDRPEICGNVGWRTLVELASTATPEAQRREIEARIMAGERLRGTDVIRARASAAAVRSAASHGLRTTDGVPGIL
jgi:hypothetical protein